MRHASLLLLALLAFAPAHAQAPLVPPPAFTWAGVYDIALRPGGGSGLWGAVQVTIASGGDMWLNRPDALVTSTYGGLGSQRLERRRPDGRLIVSRLLTGRSRVAQVRAAAGGRLYLLGSFVQQLDLDATHAFRTADPLIHDFLACFDSTGAVVYARDPRPTLAART